jgi:autotransporter-associated beta strand protein
MKINLTKRLLKSTAAKLIAAFLMSGAVQESQAVNFLWNNTGSNWTTATSWTNGVQPTATTATGTDVVQFSNYGPNNNSVDLTSTRTAQKLEFFSGANAYTFTTASAKLLEIASGGITNASSSIQTFNLRVNNSGGNYTWFTAAGGGLTFNQQVGLTTDASATSRTLTLAGDGAYVFNNNLVNNGTSLAPAAKVVYTGNGTITFNGTNIIGGSGGGGFDIIGGGTVNVNGGTGVGQALVTLGGASGTTNMPILRINTANGLSTLNSLKGSTSLSTMGTLDLLGNDPNAVTIFTMNQYQGNNMNFTNHGGGKTLLQFTNAANTLTVSTANSGGRRLFNHSTNLLVQFDGTLDIGSTTADYNVVGGVGDFIFKGSLLNTGSALRGLTKTGSGRLTLEAVNSYNGDTTVQDGLLLVNTNASIASSSSIVSGGTLQVKGIAGGVTISNGSLIVDTIGRVGNTTLGGGTLLVSGIAGNTIVNSGTATVNAGGVIGSTTINGSLLSVNGSAGDIIVNTGGTLGGSGSVQGLTLNGGIVAPGNSPGLLTAYELNGNNGTFQFQLGAPTTRGITYDAINVTSLLNLGANTNFIFETLDNYVYVLGDSYDLFNFGSIDTTGFDITTLDVALPTLSSNDLTWDTTSFTTDGMVNVVASVPEPSSQILLGFGLASLLTLRAIRRKKCQHQIHS